MRSRRTWRAAFRLLPEMRRKREIARIRRQMWDAYINAPTYREARHALEDIMRCGML